MLSTFTFKDSAADPGLHMHSSYAELPGGDVMSVKALRHVERISLTTAGTACCAHMHFTAAQARALAGELLASADAWNESTITQPQLEN